MSERAGLASLVLRMATRSYGRLCVHLLAMASISYVLFGALLLGQCLVQEAARAAGRLGADIMIVPEGTGISEGVKLIGGIPVGSSLPSGIEERIAAMSGVIRIAPQYLLSSAADPCCEMGEILLVGFDPSRDFTVQPLLRPEDGLWDKERHILAGGRVMKAPGAAMRFFDHTFTLAARLEQSRSATFDTALFIPLEGLAAMERSSRSGGNQLSIPWGKPSILLLMLAAEIEPQQMALALEHQHPGIQALPISEPVRNERVHLENLGRGRGPLTVAAWLIALLSGATFLFSNLQARRATLGLLYSCGCGNALLASMFALETFIISLAGIATGSLAAFFSLRISGQYLAMATGVPFFSGGVPRAAAAIFWCLPAFAGALSATMFIIVLFMLRSEPSELLRGNR